MKTATVIIAMFSSVAAMAQVDSLTASKFYPADSDLGITANIYGLINSINLKPREDYRIQSSFFVRTRINEKFTFRIGIAPWVMNIRESSTDSVGKDLIKYDSTARQNYFSVRPGIEWHVTGTERLDPYFALDFEAGVLGKFNSRASRDVTDTTGTASYIRTINSAGGTTIGTKISVGMNYFIAKKMALGVEYGIGLQYLSSGGDRQEVLQVQPVSGSAITTRNLGSGRINTFDLFVDPNVQVTLSYFFSL